MAPQTLNWFDRAIGAVAPRWQLQRLRARVATGLVMRHYEGASTGRRTSGWNRSAGDANAVNGNASLSRLRDVVRDLVRNNPYAQSAMATIADHVVGWGIKARPLEKNDRLEQAWNAWAESTACDADGRHDLYGLQHLVQRTVAESGECLIRRRWRLLSDGLPLPLQLQVLEPDFLDTNKTTTLPNGGAIIQGVEFDALGNRAAYWLFATHPGATFNSSASSVFSSSRRIPASEVQHVYRPTRPGQVRGVPWLASVIVRLKDLDEYEDATLVKQKIAACLAVITTDTDGTAPSLGTPDDTQTPPIDALSPGAVLNVPPGRDVEVVSPPSVGEYEAYTAVNLRAIATGLGLSYEDLTGNYTNLPFSAARMSRIRHWARVDDWRWNMLIPQFCDPAWYWAMQAAAVMGLIPSPGVEARWSPPPMPMLEPDKEGLAIQRNVRTGIQTLTDALRERGYDPEEVFAEMAATNTKLDELGIVLDSDPRRMTQAGQAQGTVLAAATPPADATPAPADGQNNLREFAELSRDIVRASRQPMHLHMTTNTPVTVQPSAAPEVRVEQSITVQPAAPAVVTVPVHVEPAAVRLEQPITVQPAAPAAVTVPVTVQPAPAAKPEPARARQVSVSRDERGNLHGTITDKP